MHNKNIIHVQNIHMGGKIHYGPKLVYILTQYEWLYVHMYICLGDLIISREL